MNKISILILITFILFSCTEKGNSIENTNNNNTFIASNETISSGGVAFKILAYTPKVSITSQGTSKAITGDMNNDGKLDIITLVNDDDDVVIHKQDNSGNFSSIRVISGNPSKYSIAVTDIDKDNKLDIVVGNGSKGKWYKNNGNDNFTPFDLPFSGNCFGIAAADMNGDNIVDIIATQNSEIFLCKNNGNQNFEKVIIDNDLDGACKVELTDINKDGKMDIILTSDVKDFVRWYKNNGNETFNKIDVTFAYGAFDVATADMDNDGKTDILVASLNDNTIRYCKNNGDNTFTIHKIFNNAIQATGVSAADINNDGKIDIISSSSADNSIRWYKNNGDNTFAPNIISNNALNACDVHTVDIDNDGDIDILAVSRGNGSISLFENKIFP